MATFRARLRRGVLRRALPLMVGQYPLEIGLVVWGLVAGLNMVTGSSPSNALQVLPDGLEQVWAVLMTLAAVTVTIGLGMRRFATIASGMYLFATILSAYAAAIIGASGWKRGGTVAVFLLVIGIVCLLRGWWLKEQEAALIKEIVRTRRKDR